MFEFLGEQFTVDLNALHNTPASEFLEEQDLEIQSLRDTIQIQQEFVDIIYEADVDDVVMESVGDSIKKFFAKIKEILLGIWNKVKEFFTKAKNFILRKKDKESKSSDPSTPEGKEEIKKKAEAKAKVIVAKEKNKNENPSSSKSEEAEDTGKINIINFHTAILLNSSISKTIENGMTELKDQKTLFDKMTKNIEQGKELDHSLKTTANGKVKYENIYNGWLREVSKITKVKSQTLKGKDQGNIISNFFYVGLNKQVTTFEAKDFDKFKGKFKSFYDQYSKQIDKTSILKDLEEVEKGFKATAEQSMNEMEVSNIFSSIPEDLYSQYSKYLTTICNNVVKAVSLQQQLATKHATELVKFKNYADKFCSWYLIEETSREMAKTM